MTNLGLMIQADLGQLRNDMKQMAPAAAVVLPTPLENTPLSFAQTLSSAVHQVDQKDRLASEEMDAVERGTGNLVNAVLMKEQARVEFSMLQEVTKKTLGGLDEVLKMQL